jgi:hypothetical protein
MRNAFKSHGCKDLHNQSYGTARAYFNTFFTPCNTDFEVGGFIWTAVKLLSLLARQPQRLMLVGRAETEDRSVGLILHAPGGTLGGAGLEDGSAEMIGEGP